MLYVINYRSETIHIDICGKLSHLALNFILLNYNVSFIFSFFLALSIGKLQVFLSQENLLLIIQTSFKSCA